MANTIRGPMSIVCDEITYTCKKIVYLAGLRSSAIRLSSSNNNDIRGNLIQDGVSGLSIWQSKNNIVLGNIISEIIFLVSLNFFC